MGTTVSITRVSVFLLFDEPAEPVGARVGAFESNVTVAEETVMFAEASKAFRLVTLLAVA